MRITRMTDDRLTLADLDAIIRMRQSLVECQIAYLSEQVAVMLITDEEDPDALREMAQRQMDEALSNMPDFSRCAACDDAPLTLLHNGCICVFAPEGDTDDSLGAHLYLRSVGLAACEQLPVRAIITGEDAGALVAPCDTFIEDGFDREQEMEDAEEDDSEPSAPEQSADEAPEADLQPHQDCTFAEIWNPPGEEDPRRTSHDVGTPEEDDPGA